MQLTRRQTMKRAGEFAMVRGQGSSQAGRFLVLGLCPYTALPPKQQERMAAEQQAEHGNSGHAEIAEVPSRFGIITTKRLGHAVTRNLLRRRVREILRQHGDPLAKGHCVVVIPRYTAANVPYSDLEKDFLHLLQRLARKQQKQQAKTPHEP